MTITAHAGCLGTPEDSLESVIAGIRAGADICEVDVSLDANSIPVLKHDGVLPGETGLVPLRDVLEFIQDSDIQLNLDIKTAAAVLPAERLAIEAGLLHRVFFTGLFEDDVRQAAESGSVLPRYFNFNIAPDIDDEALEWALRYALRHGCAGINSNHAGVTLRAVDMVHGAGLLLSAWTADEPRDMARLLTMGVDNITTRRPDLLKQLLSQA